jgi:serine/threonine-protein kinase
MVAAPRLLAGRYRLIEPIGEGGMAVVWRAYDEVLRRSVAVKLLATELRDDGQLRAEAQAAALLNHPNVSAIHDYGVAADEPFVVMELLDGITLAARLTSGPLPWQDAVDVLTHVAAALSAAHAHGLVHRDIKPANIMLTAAGVKVVDFGIAAFVGSHVDGPIMGTPGYVAPERLAGNPGGPAADVYALGVMLFTALTGRRPTDGWHGLPGEPGPAPLPPIPGMPAEVTALYEECVALDPDRRPSAATTARRLATLAGVRTAAVGSEPPPTSPTEPQAVTATVTAEPPSAPPRRRPLTRRTWVITATAGVALIAVAAAAAAVGLSPGTTRVGARESAASCSVAYRVTDTWANGATVSLAITNTGTTAIKGWTLRFDLKEGLHARPGWSGRWQQQGRRVTVTATPNNASLEAGMSTDGIGTNIDGQNATSIPDGITINGNHCRTDPPLS